jgi:membrane protein YqaA with SNARE-associated domain
MVVNSNEMRRSDQLLILSIAGISVYFVLGLILPELTSPFAVAYNILLDLSLLFGYSGALIIAFVGNATVLFPFPYIGVPFILGGLADEATSLFLFDPWLIGIAAGLGAILGEMTGYFIGYGGGKLIDQEQTSSFKSFIESHPRATPLLIWFLAATPIPDDVLIVPLGVARYSWWKVALPQFVGKTMFMWGIAWAGRFGLSIIESIFGGTDPMNLFSRTLEVAALLSVIIAVYLLVRIDWNRLIASKD